MLNLILMWHYHSYTNWAVFLLLVDKHFVIKYLLRVSNDIICSAVDWFSLLLIQLLLHF
jgi:hypothetical protein